LLKGLQHSRLLRPIRGRDAGYAIRECNTLTYVLYAPATFSGPALASNGWEGGYVKVFVAPHLTAKHTLSRMSYAARLPRLPTSFSESLRLYDLVVCLGGRCRHCHDWISPTMPHFVSISSCLEFVVPCSCPRYYIVFPSSVDPPDGPKTSEDPVSLPCALVARNWLKTPHPSFLAIV
jgi:hypothetical protein